MEKKKRIMAVDDSSMVLKALEMLLSEEYEINCFTKGMRALKYLKETAVLPDLIILDVDMPEIDGYEMIKMIKSKYNLKDIPVIFLTSNGSKEHVVKAISAGAKDYAVKPIDSDVLLTKIHAILGASQSVSWKDI